MDQYADTGEIDSISQKENKPRLKQTRRHKHKHGMQNSVAVPRQGKQSDGLQTAPQDADAVITIKTAPYFSAGWCLCDRKPDWHFDGVGKRKWMNVFLIDLPENKQRKRQKCKIFGISRMKKNEDQKCCVSSQRPNLKSPK